LKRKEQAGYGPNHDDDDGYTSIVKVRTGFA
jgi:hypothetical protein